MQRENLRQLILTISAFLMPFTLFFVSPIVILIAAGDGVINSSAILFILLFFISIFFGRIWCGWLCPFGGMQEAISKSCEKKPSGGKKDYIKFILFVPWIAFIIYSFAATGISGINPLYGTEDGIFPEILYVYLFLLAVFVIFTFIFGSRSVCRYICPTAVIMIIGRKAGSILSLPQLRLKAEPENCTGCRVCDSACIMGIKVSEMVKSGNTENSECITCGACANACKKNAVKFGIFRR
ncbi:MAG: 4Fe-4S binding protein [Methanomicrobium sp.]|nr:4Fe-4S binding protein [Methanomicrobium sp.]